MKIILANGAELHPVMVNGGARGVHGAVRDTLSFVFEDGDIGMEGLDDLFTPAACETICIVEGEEEYIHKGYTVRAELVKKQVEAEKAGPDHEAVWVERITVTMAQRTYEESMLASLTDTVDVLVMESLMG